MHAHRSKSGSTHLSQAPPWPKIAGDDLSLVAAHDPRCKLRAYPRLRPKGELLDRIALQALSDPQLRVPTIPIRHVDQASHPANKGVFIAGQNAIRIGHLPQHL